MSYETFRVTNDGRFYEVILKFNKFSDCKHFIIDISSKYDKDYLTGTNFIVKNGFYAVLFFDLEETNPEKLEPCILDLLAGAGHGYEFVKVSDDVFWINELLRQSEFSLLGNADVVLNTFSDEWRL